MNFIDFVDDLVKTQQVFHSILEGNEAQTRWMLIDPMLLDGLGYSREDIIVEYNLENKNADKYNKLDYSIIVDNKPKLLVEAKSYGVNLYDKYSQLEEYFLTILNRYEFVERELIGILTDGDTYLLYTNNLNKNRMDKSPFYRIQLSVSEDLERLKLLEYSKPNILNKKSVSLLSSDEEYELRETYRIDVIEGVIDYFDSIGISTKIDKVYLKGKYKNINSFRTLYRELISSVNSLKPDFLYNVAVQEDMNENKKISSQMFSMYAINSTCISMTTSKGVVYISIPSNHKSIIKRIIHLANISGFGVQNILISLKGV